MIKEWLLSKILGNKTVFFKQDDEYLLINDIYFDDDVVIMTYEKHGGVWMTEKQYLLVKCYTEMWGIYDKKQSEIDNPILIAYSKKSVNFIVNQLNNKNERIKELETKLNQTALELLNYDMITMGKAAEISEMSYIDFLKYRKKNGNPMELQLWLKKNIIAWIVNVKWIVL